VDAFKNVSVIHLVFLISRPFWAEKKIKKVRDWRGSMTPIALRVQEFHAKQGHVILRHQ
jgi:hypothetical protein